MDVASPAKIMDNEISMGTGLLVIGYGNTLRGDDGVGPRVAEAVGRLWLPGVRTLICPLLTPELADPVSRARKVIFVDAAVDLPQQVQWRKLVPGETTQLMAHAADPRTLLALARDVFGRSPEAWWLTISRRVFSRGSARLWGGLGENSSFLPVVAGKLIPALLFICAGLSPLVPRENPATPSCRRRSWRTARKFLRDGSRGSGSQGPSLD